MIPLITLTRYAAGRPFPVNAGAIAYFDECAGGAVVAFGSGETLRVCETVVEIKALIAAASAPSRGPTTAADPEAIIDLWRRAQPDVLELARARVAAPHKQTARRR